MNTCWPHIAESLSAIMRATISVGPPAPKARDVKANGDHVGRDGAVHPLLDLIEWCFEAAPRFRDFVGGNARSKLDYLGQGLPILKQASRFADPLAASISLDRILDLFLENPSRSSQLAQAVEVASRAARLWSPAGREMGPFNRRGPGRLWTRRP